MFLFSVIRKRYSLKYVRRIALGKRIEWIDTAKGIGLILVILGHLHIPFMTTWIYLFHMPLFFFLSGLVYSGGKYTWKQYLIKKAKSLLV